MCSLLHKHLEYVWGSTPGQVLRGGALPSRAPVNQAQEEQNTALVVLTVVGCCLPQQTSTVVALLATVRRCCFLSLATAVVRLQCKIRMLKETLSPSPDQCCGQAVMHE